jgi:putative hemolysin
MQSILFESLIILGLLLTNGVLAASEIAVVTSRRSRLERQAASGSAGATRALTLVDDPTRFLSTVQIGITLIGVLAGAFGGATIATQLDARLESIPGLAPYSEFIAVGIVVSTISFASLVLGELVPKRIAMQAPERVAAFVALPMQLIARIARPAVTLLTFTTTSILRALRISEARGTRVTEEEIRAMIAEGRQSGAVQAAEHDMLEGVFALGEGYVRDVMVPRHAVDWYDVEDGLDGLRQRLTRPEGECILVCRGTVDEVVGVLRSQRMLAAALAGSTHDPLAVVEQPLFVPGSMEILRLLVMFRSSQVRAAVVLDEFGGVEGFVTLDELLAPLVGEAGTGASPVDESSKHRTDGSWFADGAADFDVVARRLGLAAVPERERGTYRTLAGFVMARLARVPRVGDRATWEGVTFEVVDMDERRVDKVLIIPKSVTKGDSQ